MIFVLVLVFIAFLLIPELISNVESLINSIPKVINDLKVWIVDLLDKYPDIQVQINNAFSNSEHSVSSIVYSILN
jgi:predicted PurR-regulated permease PerM